MTIHFNMFGGFAGMKNRLMKNRIHINLNSTGIISMKGNMSKLRNIKFANNPQRHTILEQAHDIALYSNSVDDFETRACFLLFQEMTASPRNIHQPTIKWQVSTQPAQLRSLKPTKYKRLPGKEEQATTRYPFEISKKMTDNSQIYLTRSLQKPTHLLNNKWYIKLSNDQIFKLPTSYRYIEGSEKGSSYVLTTLNLPPKK
jgi:hypothetical protein